MGDMSIVGPRPHMLSHTEEYSKLIGQYMIRQFLKPGITGWAQVKGFRGETKTVSQMAERVEHDIWYMENWSLMLDIRILFLTLFETFKGSKNAF
jgi:putative colanic acid biosynthesis UDP-glucose lipid carrier transferase